MLDPFDLILLIGAGLEMADLVGLLGRLALQGFKLLFQDLLNPFPCSDVIEELLGRALQSSYKVRVLLLTRCSLGDSPVLCFSSSCGAARLLGFLGVDLLRYNGVFILATLILLVGGC